MQSAREKQGNNKSKKSKRKPFVPSNRLKLVNVETGWPAPAAGIIPPVSMRSLKSAGPDDAVIREASKNSQLPPLNLVDIETGLPAPELIIDYDQYISETDYLDELARKETIKFVKTLGLIPPLEYAENAFILNGNPLQILPLGTKKDATNELLYDYIRKTVCLRYKKKIADYYLEQKRKAGISHQSVLVPSGFIQSIIPVTPGNAVVREASKNTKQATGSLVDKDTGLPAPEHIVNSKQYITKKAYLTGQAWSKAMEFIQSKGLSSPSNIYTVYIIKGNPDQILPPGTEKDATNQTLYSYFLRKVSEEYKNKTNYLEQKQKTSITHVSGLIPPVAIPPKNKAKKEKTTKKRKADDLKQQQISIPKKNSFFNGKGDSKQSVSRASSLFPGLDYLEPNSIKENDPLTFSRETWDLNLKGTSPDTIEKDLSDLGPLKSDLDFPLSSEDFEALDAFQLDDSFSKKIKT